MIKVGINYLSEMPKEKVEKLAKDGVIDFLKFPGIRCNEQELDSFFKDLPDGIKADPHGILNFRPAWNMPNITEGSDKDINKKLVLETGAGWFSTHIGWFPGEIGDPIQNFYNNLESLRTLFPGIKLGAENVFAYLDKDRKPAYMTLQSCDPDLINWMWQQVDFGVFDTIHAKMASDDYDMNYWEYMKMLDPEKVKLIHVSGGVMNFRTGDINKSHYHQPCTKEDLLELREVLEYFKNATVVVSEVSRGIGPNNEVLPLSVEEYCEEAYNLSETVRDFSRKRCR